LKYDEAKTSAKIKTGVDKKTKTTFQYLHMNFEKTRAASYLKRWYPWQLVTDSFSAVMFLEWNGIFWHVLRGQLTLTLSFYIFYWFSQNANVEVSGSVPLLGPGFSAVPMKKFLSEASYGVYVFHWMTWPMVLWFYLAFIDRPADLQFFKASDRTFVSDSREGWSGWSFFGAWIFVVLVSNALLWPFAFCIRKIPGVDQVL